MLGSSAASYLKFPRTWLEVNGSTTVQLHFAMVTRCWIAPIHRWSYWNIRMLQYRNISAPLVQASSRQLSKRDMFCISGTSADGVSKWGWVSLHNRAGKVLPSLSKCQKKTFFLISRSYLFICRPQNCIHYSCYRILYLYIFGVCMTYFSYRWLQHLLQCFWQCPCIFKIGCY